MAQDPGQPESPIDARGLRVAVVASRYNPAVMDRLLDGAIAEFARLGGDRGDLTIIRAPGAFELPVLAARLARGGEYDVVVALACIIRGQTTHDRVLADAVAGALMRVAVETGVPVGFGVLTVEDTAQAEARAGGAPGDRGNKGAEALAAAVETARTLASL